MHGRPMPTAVDRQARASVALRAQVHHIHHRNHEHGTQWLNWWDARTIRTGIALTAVRRADHEIRGIALVGTVAVLDNRRAGESTHSRRQAIGVQGQKHLRPQQCSDRQERNSGAQASAAKGIHLGWQSSVACRAAS